MGSPYFHPPETKRGRRLQGAQYGLFGFENGAAGGTRPCVEKGIVLGMHALKVRSKEYIRGVDLALEIVAVVREYHQVRGLIEKRAFVDFFLEKNLLGNRLAVVKAQLPQTAGNLLTDRCIVRLLHAAERIFAL